MLHGHTCWYAISSKLLALLWARRNGLPPTPNTLHLGCSYHLHSSHHFLSTWGAAMLGGKKKKKKVDTQHP